MRPDLGRFLEGRDLATVKLLLLLHDLAAGAAKDTVVWVEGRELVVGRTEPRSGRGFVRITPLEHAAMLAFPRGPELFDPKKRAVGPRRSETRMTLRDALDVDPYVRRLVAQACALDEPPPPPPPPEPEPEPEEEQYYY